MASSTNPRVTSHTERRTTNSSTTRSRVPSTRANESDKNGFTHTAGDNGSKDNESASKKSTREYSDKRVERTQIREKTQIQTRSPVKESSTAANRGDRREKTKSSHQRGAGLSSGGRGSREIPEAPWHPQASLISPTSAPLSSRVTMPPLSSQAPASLLPRPLKEMSMEEQEWAIVDDLLWVFMGYEGQYVRFVDSYNPMEERDRLVGPSFRILPGLDPSLRDLTTSMLQMATHYCALETFVEVQSREEFGAVNHSLAATIRKLLKEYLMLIAQLESQLLSKGLTLHVLHLQTLPTGQSLLQLYSLAQELLKRNSLLGQDLDESVDDFDVDNILEQLREGGDLVPGGMSSKRICKGGSVLGLLTLRLASLSGDPAARTLLQTLLREAGRPYMAMLNEWLHHGGIKDPHAEFLVKEQAGIKRERLEEDYIDEYWEKRYTIRENDVPPQLESVKDKVLLAGKYLNVVRECGGVDISKEVKDVPKTFDDPRFLDNVNGAYAYANASLLNLLLTKNSLTTRFRSLKHYFFLDRSDFFSYFLELSAPELRKPAKHVNVSKLQSLLEMVLHQNGSIAAQDPFREDVRVQMNEVGLTKWLMRVVSVSGFDQDNPDATIEKYQTPAPDVPKDDEKDIIGFEALQLDYSVPFPLSLVISRKTVLRYQLLFRYLLSLRHLETQLASCWQDHSKELSWIHRSKNPKIELWKRRAWTLRARMLVFVQQLLYFCTAEVLEPNWQNLMARVDTDDKSSTGKQAVNRTVDEIMQAHVDFLDTCLKGCMLTQGKLLKLHSKLMFVCTMFAAYTPSLTRSLIAADADLANSPAAAASIGSSSKHQTGSSSSSSNLAHDPSRLAKMEDTLKRYEDNFNRHLRMLTDSLNYYAATETVVLLGLCARLSAASEGVGMSGGNSVMGSVVG